MEGNVSFYQVNLGSRITGEGGGRSFEGRGGLVLIKSERVWRGGWGGGGDNHSFGGDSVRSSFPSRPQYAIHGTGILGQIASFERRLRGAAQTPLALPYPFRTWPGAGTWADRDEREVRNFWYFGRHTPEPFLDLGIIRA